MKPTVMNDDEDPKNELSLKVSFESDRQYENGARSQQLASTKTASLKVICGITNLNPRAWWRPPEQSANQDPTQKVYETTRRNIFEINLATAAARSPNRDLENQIQIKKPKATNNEQNRNHLIRRS
jgi:hypothetical protein